MPRQFVQPSQVACDGFERHVLAHRHHVEVHERAHGVLGIGHCRAELLALFERERLDDVLDDVLGQVGRQVGELVGLQRLGRGHEFLGVHARDKRLAHRVGNLEQDLPVPIGLDEVPDHKPLLQRERLQDECDVGRVQALDLAAQFGKVLLVHHLLDEFVLRHVLPGDQALDDRVTMQELLHLAQVLLQVFDFKPVGKVGHGGDAWAVAASWGRACIVEKGRLARNPKTPAPAAKGSVPLACASR